MPDDRLVLKGIPPELKLRLAVAAAQERCFPRDIVIRLLDRHLPDGPSVTGPANTDGQP